MTEESQLRRALALRFKKIRGQILGVERMLSTQELDSIFIQLSAARSALDKASLLVLENHMKSCLLTAPSPQGLAEEKESLIRFIQDYKYGCSHSVRYVAQNVVVLLAESVDRISQVIETLEAFEEGACDTILKNTSEIRELLSRVGLILFEEEIKKAQFDQMDNLSESSLEKILHMAKKFII